MNKKPDDIRNGYIDSLPDGYPTSITGEFPQDLESLIIKREDWPDIIKQVELKRGET